MNILILVKRTSNRKSEHNCVCQLIDDLITYTHNACENVKTNSAVAGVKKVCALTTIGNKGCSHPLPAN